MLSSLPNSGVENYRLCAMDMIYARKSVTNSSLWILIPRNGALLYDKDKLNFHLFV